MGIQPAGENGDFKQVSLRLPQSKSENPFEKIFLFLRNILGWLDLTNVNV